MLVREVVQALQGLNQEAKLIIVDDDTGDWQDINRVCESEDPPDDGSPEAWIVPVDG